jgi:hypothetical protein
VVRNPVPENGRLGATLLGIMAIGGNGTARADMDEIGSLSNSLAGSSRRDCDSVPGLQPSLGRIVGKRVLWVKSVDKQDRLAGRWSELSSVGSHMESTRSDEAVAIGKGNAYR